MMQHHLQTSFLQVGTSLRTINKQNHSPASILQSHPGGDWVVGLLTQIGTEILPLVLLSPDHIMTIRIGAPEFGDNLLAQLIVDWNRTHKPFQLHSVDTFVDADHLRNPLVP